MISKTIGTRKSFDENIINDIKRAMRRHISLKGKTRIDLDGLGGQDGIPELCFRAGAPTARISNGRRTLWIEVDSAASRSAATMGKCRLAGDSARAAGTDEFNKLAPCSSRYEG